ncbi:MAG: hypothetical protein H6620_07585 [Halobacteriovoraceae bacterium]|nr:hypothetical protein [Halobacteriovoraceae bacterium]
MEEVKEYFHDHFADLIEDYPNLGLNFLARDGHILHSENAIPKSEMGALYAGLWEASQQLLSDEETVLSFANSQNGFYLLALDTKAQFLLGASFKNEINPAKLKFDLLKLVRKFQSEFDFSEILTPHRDDFLFDKISDSEMDLIFKGMDH